jgi:hypothetical protein
VAIVTTLCNTLESVIPHYICDAPIEKDDRSAPLMYNKLRSFKLIYCIYIMVYSLHILSSFFFLNQLKFVGVNSIRSIVKTEIIQNLMLFIVKTIDLKVKIC